MKKRIYALFLIFTLSITLVLSGCGQHTAVDHPVEPSSLEVAATAAAETEPPQETVTETESETEVTTEETTEEVTLAPTEVTLIAVGDMLLHGGIHNSALQADGTYNYSHVFEHTIEKIAAADIAVANQEVILGGVELGVSSYPSFNSPQDFGDALVTTGFDVILHASNHTMDKDTIGILNTLHFWKEKHPDITYLGINETQEERDTIKVMEVNDIRIAMLNYTYGLNGYTLPSDKPYLVNMLEEEAIANDLAKAKELADFVIVYPHWGTEYNLATDDSQTYWAQFFADHGADLIIGTHPHVVEPVNWITAADGRQVLVYYSLGNFISIQYYNYSMLGGMAEITIRKDSDGTYISNYDMDFLVTHYTAGRTEMTTYLLDNYTDELAARHAILIEPYQSQYAEGYTNINQWYPFTVAGLKALSEQICPELADYE